MPVTLETVDSISVGDTENISVNYTVHLDAGELLTGTPTIVEVTTADLSLSNKQINTVAYVDKDGTTVAIGMAAQCTVSGGTAANSPYTIRVTVTTDATQPRTFVRDLELTWE